MPSLDPRHRQHTVLTRLFCKKWGNGNSGAWTSGLAFELQRLEYSTVRSTRRKVWPPLPCRRCFSPLARVAGRRRGQESSWRDGATRQTAGIGPSPKGGIVGLLGRPCTSSLESQPRTAVACPHQVGRENSSDGPMLSRTDLICAKEEGLPGMTLNLARSRGVSKQAREGYLVLPRC